MRAIKGRSDVASEAVENLGIADGLKREEIKNGDVSVTRITLSDEKVAKAVGREVGHYVTVDIGMAYEDDKVFTLAAETVASELSKIIGRKVLKKKFSALVVGLGNSDLTSDAVGPESAKGIIATRHIKENASELFEKMKFGEVSVTVPGVLGSTGIESSESVKAVAEKISPDIVIAIDALASDSPERLCRSVQITDTGIFPGSGVGNCRKELSEKTLGRPVIAVGLTTVSDSLTVAGKVLAALDRVTEFETGAVLEKLQASALNFIVTPKDIDILVKKSARLISIAINKALHNGISEEDINALMNG